VTCVTSEGEVFAHEGREILAEKTFSASGGDLPREI
jgi:hypothetical protein